MPAEILLLNLQDALTHILSPGPAHLQSSSLLAPANYPTIIITPTLKGPNLLAPDSKGQNSAQPSLV